MNRPRFTTKDNILMAMLAALTATLSQITMPLPFTPVPINLALLSVFVAGGLLGAVRGGLSQLIYVLLGAVGIPVFGEFTGGLVIIMGPTGGYIIGYIIAAVVIGFLKDKLPQTHFWCIFSMLVGLSVCYILGTAWFMYVLKTKLLYTLSLCVLPYLPGDFLKVLTAAFLVKALEKYPNFNH